MAMKEITLDDMLGDAIKETDREIFAEATGSEQKPIDETGDTSVEEMGDGLEGQHEPDEDGDTDSETDGEQEEGESESQEDAEEDDRPRDERGQFKAKEEEDGEGDKADAKDRQREPSNRDHRVPVGELKSEREKRQAVEREREAERKAFNDQIAALTQRINDLAAGRQTPQPQAQPQPQQNRDPMPDILLDPQGYQAWQTRQFDQRIMVERANMQMRVAQIRHGETYDKAYAWVKGLDKSDPENQRVIASIEASPDIGEALVSTFRRAEALKEVGDDPAKYRAKVRDDLLNDPEFLAEVAARLGGERGEPEPTRGQTDGRPRQVYRIPKSLNGASGTGNSSKAASGDPELYNDSDKSVFSFAMR